MDPIELATGDGLVLRAWQPEDAEDVFRACQDPLIQRWTLVPVPYRPEHAADFTGAVTRAAWAAQTSAPLGVFDARTGDLLGSSGLVALDRAGGAAEVGTWVAPWARGRRVAERAGRAVAHWAFEVLRLRRLTWRAEVGNHASRLTAERIGFTFDGVVRAGLPVRGGGFADGWQGVLLPGEVCDTPPAWVAPGGPGARRAHAFSHPPERLPAGACTLRALRESDLDDVVATFRDPGTVQWTSIPLNYRPEQGRDFIRHAYPAMWLRGTGAGFAFADRDDRFAGTVDLRISVLDPVTAEVGYSAAPWARGKGYTTEAVRAACAYGFERLALGRIVWRAHVGNNASRRVAEKVGFLVEGVQRESCVQRGERVDGWMATLLPGDLA
ncbi:GNAT family N-acetyltransferase [Dactylosporangium sp. NPDC049140]|jgi:RimJ/RimL family protein N-acetyltransferase|uniref:GNAT family N-acetyltransferase n=1 Tax=Dactylosporangium sp. NPDC049140 TaxID=3155647 RepID=UPI0033ECE471